MTRLTAQDPVRGFYVEGLQEFVVRSYAEVCPIITFLSSCSPIVMLTNYHISPSYIPHAIYQPSIPTTTCKLSLAASKG